MIIGDNFFAYHVSSADVYSRVKGQMTFGAESLIAKRTDVHFMLLFVSVLQHGHGFLLRDIVSVLGDAWRQLQKVTRVRLHVHLIIFWFVVVYVVAT